MSETPESKVLRAENEKLKKIIESLDQNAQMLILKDIELRAANDKLRSLDTQKLEFIAIAAHQLRTPLTSIRFAHQMLSDDIADKLLPDQLKVLTNARISIDRMFNMIEDLIVIDDIDYGELKLHYEPVAMDKIIEEILLIFNEAVRIKSIQIKCTSKGTVKNVGCDARRIKDAISNIIDNAIKYTPEKGEVSISCDYLESTVIITVSDTGIGVDEEDAELLFKKFSRLDTAKRIDANGSGLGLYIAKKIIERHVGSINFKHNVPKGSSFIISLPI